MDLSKTKIQWCEFVLNQHHCPMIGEFKPVRLMPWSQVYNINTPTGHLFFKQLTQPFSIETRLIKKLNQLFPDITPNIIAANLDELCFIMQDSGVPLRIQLLKNYQLEIVQNAIEQYVKIQIKMSNHVKQLMSLKVPDWGLENFSPLFENILSKEEMLENDGVTQEELSKLKKLKPKVQQIVENLLKYNIPQTLEHGDFHDNNILIKEGHITLNDWGDSVLTHPFFSLASFLHSASRNHGFSKQSLEYNEIKRYYLQAWQDFEPLPNLHKIFDNISLINPIKFVASFSRILDCPGMQDLGEYQGTMHKALQKLILTLL